jgi:hypothetical protein
LPQLRALRAVVEEIQVCQRTLVAVTALSLKPLVEDRQAEYQPAALPDRPEFRGLRRGGAGAALWEAARRVPRVFTIRSGGVYMLMVRHSTQRSLAEEMPEDASDGGGEPVH